MKTIVSLSVAAGLLACVSTLPSPAEALSSRYGCYEVVSGRLNIREKAWSRSRILTVARKGDTLAKRRRFCALRGYWCPVTTKDGVKGWAGKEFLKRTAC